MTESAEIKVKVRGPQQSLEIVVFPSMRYIDFKDLVASKLQISQEVDLLVGFPPDILDLDDDELIGSRIKNNESIRVQLSSLHGQQKQGKPKKPSANVSKAKKVNGVSTSEKRTIATLSNPKGIAKSTSQSSSRPTGIGRVRALRSNVSRRTRAASATAGSAEDVAEHLIAAASGGSGSRDRMLRGVFRKAVEHQYNATQAVARIHAVFGHQYRFEVSNASSQRLGDGNEPPALMRKLKVTYKRGMGLRGEYMDEVDLIPAEILKTILRLPLLEQANDPADATDSGLNREVLKPINLAKASPRIYWSIVFHHGNDVAGSIAAMIADIDNGEWLFDRKRELSEKAKENKRQQDEKELLRHAKKRKVGGEIAVNLESTGGVASSSIPSDLMEKVTNLQLDEEVLDAEIVGSLCGHLGGDRVIMLAEADGPTLCGKSGLSLDQIEFFIRSAQTRIHEVVYCHLLHGSQALKVVLNRLRIRCMKELLIWKSAGSGLFDGLIAVGPQITQLNLRWPDHEGLTCEDVEALLRLADACSNRWRFLCDIEASQSIIEDCEQWEEADRDQSVDEDIWADSWSIDAESNEFIGKRTRIFDCADASACSWWEDGIVVGFLPSSIEEPMALWRVRFDSFTAKSDSRAGRFEDLEQHEVDLAVKRLAL